MKPGEGKMEARESVPPLYVFTFSVLRSKTTVHYTYVRDSRRRVLEQTAWLVIGACPTAPELKKRVCLGGHGGAGGGWESEQKITKPQIPSTPRRPFRAFRFAQQRI